MRVIFTVCCLMLVMPLYAMDDFDRQQVLQRIRPIGSVRVQGQTSTPAKPVADVPKTRLEAGQATYEKYCVVCHQNGLAGAPRFRLATDWKLRLDKQSIDGLTATAVKGFNAMPAKGTCSECTEDDIKQAIRYMLPQS